MNMCVNTIGNAYISATSLLDLATVLALLCLSFYSTSALHHPPNPVSNLKFWWR